MKEETEKKVEGMAGCRSNWRVTEGGLGRYVLEMGANKKYYTSYWFIFTLGTFYMINQLTHF